MNRPLIGVIFIISAIIFSIASLFYIKQTRETMTEHLNLVLESASVNNEEDVKAHIDAAFKHWEKRDDFLNIIIGQGETNNVRRPLSMAYEFAKTGDIESVILHITECKTQIELMEKLNEPTLSTIF